MNFTVEIKGSQKRELEVEIYINYQGLESLIKRLELLRKNGGHTHFMTPSWSGNDLTEEKTIASNDLVNHLRITVVPTSSN
jgi:hypothetical protein